MILFIGNYLSSVQQADIAFLKTKIRPTKPAVLPEFENVAKIIMCCTINFIIVLMCTVRTTKQYKTNEMVESTWILFQRQCVDISRKVSPDLTSQINKAKMDVVLANDNFVNSSNVRRQSSMILNEPNESLLSYYDPDLIHVVID